MSLKHEMSDLKGVGTSSGVKEGPQHAIYFARITLTREKDPLYMNIRNPIPPQRYQRIPNIDPV